MRIAIVGAGAMGGVVGTRLASRGAHEVRAIARGATLAALRTHGWRMRSGGTLTQAPCAGASDDARDLGVQDLVIVALKAQDLPAVAPQLTPLVGAHTRVLSLMNGVPWWFTHGLAGLDAPLASVDPDGVIARTLPSARTLGGVLHMAGGVAEPGLAEHRFGGGIIVGEVSARAADAPGVSASEVVQSLADAGFQAVEATDIRRDVWYKLWGNMTINPISVLTGSMSDTLLTDPPVRDFITACMHEAAAIGERLGCPVAQTPEDRHQVTLMLGAFKSSMLQDAEAGRRIELDALVGAPRELGARVGLATPNLDALFAITRLHAIERGLYPR